MKYTGSIIATVLCSSLFGFENIPPVQDIPGGIDSNRVPLFINLGFDDNKFADGVDWVRDTLLKGRYNNSGSGNHATYDGTPMVASFYVIGNSDYPWSETPFEAPLPNERPVTDSWRRAYDAGLPISNHTWTHEHNLSDLAYDRFQGERPSLLAEVGMCSKYLVNIAGIPHMHIHGFRTPYLASSASNNDSFRTLWELGMLYDCTLDNGMQGNQQAEWARPYFPGTMTEGWIWYTQLATPGLWQIPNSIYPQGETAVFSDKGFDSGRNGWPGGATAESMFNQMKWAISYHYRRNRAPLDLGLHSDYYSATAQNRAGTAASNFRTPLAERQRSLIMLLDWIEAELPDARVVGKYDIIQWMRNPVALDDISKNHLFEFPSKATFKTLTGGSSIANGESSSHYDGRGGVDVTVVDQKGNWISDSYAGVSYPLNDQLKEGGGIRIRYTSDLPLRLVLKDPNLGMSSYSAGLPSTLGKENVVELPLSRYFFEQPRPVENRAEFNLSQISEIALIAEVIDTTMSGKISATVEYATDGSTSIVEGDRSITNLNVQISENRLSLNLPKSGNYNITLTDIRGRVLLNESYSLQAGAQDITIPSNIAPGVILMSLYGGETKFNTTLLKK